MTGITWMTLCLTQATAVFAQGRYVHLGRHFRDGGESGDPATFGLFVASLVAVLVVVLVVARRVSARHAPGYCSPNALFQELCRLHGLDWASRRLLKRVAKQQGLETPSQLFLEPARLAADRLQGPLAAYRQQAAGLVDVLTSSSSDPDEQR